jgi:hypothetical protein
MPAVLLVGIGTDSLAAIHLSKRHYSWQYCNIGNNGQCDIFCNSN